MVQITATDSRGAKGIQQFIVHVVEQLNASPVFISIPAIHAQPNLTYQYNALARDPDGDALTYDLVTAPAGMIVETNSGIVAWRPLFAQLGVHDVILRATDSRAGVGLQSFQITVTPPNTAPFITSVPPGPATVSLPYRYVVRTQDAEGQPLTFLLGSNAPAGMTLTNLESGQSLLTSAATAVLDWTPAITNAGTNRIEIMVRDSEGAEARQVFDLEVVPSSVNRSPQFVSTPRTQARIGLPYAYLPEAIDADGDPLTLQMVSGPPGMVLTNGSPSPWPSPPGEGILLWFPTELGSFPVGLTVNDGRSGGVVTQQFSITVTSTLSNSAPVIVSTPPFHGTVAQPYEYNAMAEDPDDDFVTWQLVQGPLGMSLDPATGALRWSPTFDQLGTNAVVIEAQDALLSTATQTFQIEVGCVNQSPSITSIPPTLAQVGESYLYALRATDPDGDTLTFTLLPPYPLGMTLSNLTGSAGVSPGGLRGALLKWIPTTNQVGAWFVQVRVTDGHGGTDTQQYTLYANNEHANHQPVFVSKPITATPIASDAQPVTQLMVLTNWSMTTISNTYGYGDGRPNVLPDWQIEANRIAVKQFTNSNASALLSDFLFDKGLIQGTWRVEDTGVNAGFDDDFIGFIFGYQDDTHFYLFDWRMGDQAHLGAIGLAGMSVKVIHASSPLGIQDLWATYTDTNRVETLYHNAVPWRNLTDYQWNLSLQNGGIHIRAVPETRFL